MLRSALLLLMLAGCSTPAVATCGTGSWRPGTLEIHHFDVGQADATLIVAPSGKSLLVDLGETAWDSRDNAVRVGAKIERILGCRRLDHVIITHFHLDHVGAVGRGGLWHLAVVQGFAVSATWHRDVSRFAGARGPTLTTWRELLGDATLLAPRPIALGAELDLGPEVSLRVVGADAAGVLPAGDLGELARAPNENDYSVAFHLRFGQLDYFAGGDLSGALVANASTTSHDVETEVARRLPDVDVYRVNHHGSNHSSNATLLAQIDPEVAIVSVAVPSPHGHPGPAALDRLRATAAVYLTARLPARPGRLAGVTGLGDVVVRSRDGRNYQVGDDAFLATDPIRADADEDGYLAPADPDDNDPRIVPAPVGGCEPAVEALCRAGFERQARRF